MPLPILYSFRRCPYAMRARLAVAVSGMAVELREIRLRDKPPEMLAASPKGTVPVMVLQDGRVIDESLDIMRYVLRIHDPASWLSGDDPALISINDGAFKHHLDRYKYANRYGEDGAPHRDACTAFLGDLDARLRSSANLVTGHPSLTDMALLPFIRQFAETDRDYFDALPYAALQKWLALHLGSPLFQRVMVKLEPWSPDGPTVTFTARQETPVPAKS